MRYRLLLSLLVTVNLLAQAQDTLPIYYKLADIAVIEQKVMIPMRDGVRLATDIYRPKGGGRHPLILSRTPYNFNSWVDGKMTSRSFEEAYEAVSRGYAFAVQNERGRFFSEGEWDILGTPVTDGDDAFTWFAAPPWPNGKIGRLFVLLLPNGKWRWPRENTPHLVQLLHRDLVPVLER